MVFLILITNGFTGKKTFYKSTSIFTPVLPMMLTGGPDTKGDTTRNVNSHLAFTFFREIAKQEPEFDLNISQVKDK